MLTKLSHTQLGHHKPPKLPAGSPGSPRALGIRARGFIGSGAVLGESRAIGSGCRMASPRVFRVGAHPESPPLQTLTSPTPSHKYRLTYLCACLCSPKHTHVWGVFISTTWHPPVCYQYQPPITAQDPKESTISTSIQYPNPISSNQTNQSQGSLALPPQVKKLSWKHVCSEYPSF